MKDAILLFQFLDDRCPKGEFMDVNDFLSGLGYDDDNKKHQFLRALEDRKYITINKNPLGLWTPSGRVGYIESDPQKYMIKLEPDGEQYLSENQRSESNVVSNVKIANGTIGGALVGALGLSFGIYQYVQNVENETIINDQKTIIIQTQTELDSLRSQVQHLQQIQMPKQPPR